MLPVVETPVIAKGNCGIPEYVDGGGASQHPETGLRQ
jgi:hypothetical protein